MIANANQFKLDRSLILHTISDFEYFTGVCGLGINVSIYTPLLFIQLPINYVILLATNTMMLCCPSYCSLIHFPSLVNIPSILIECHDSIVVYNGWYASEVAFRFFLLIHHGGEVHMDVVCSLT